MPQWPVVDPHQPYCEQQLPKVEPWQVKPPVPAQVPSVETFLAAAEVAAALVEVALVVGVAALEAEAPLQVPKAVLQPVPQWSTLEPQ